MKSTYDKMRKFRIDSSHIQNMHVYRGKMKYDLKILQQYTDEKSKNLCKIKADDLLNLSAKIRAKKKELISK